MSVTIHDVAKLAGVSHTTVSWAIHNHPGITDTTKEKVFKAIKELDYHPNYLARSLVKGKTNTIAVIAAFFSSPFEMEVLKGIEQSINNHVNPYMITLFSTMGKNDVVLKDVLFGKRADAVILLSITPSEEITNLYKDRCIPLIVVDEEAQDAMIIQMNNYRGGYLAAEHLLQKGRKNLALVAGDNADAALSQRERKRGFLQALTDYNTVFNEQCLFNVEDYYFEEGQLIFKRILKKSLPIDGIFCAAGDIIAMGIMLEARNQNFSIPEDYSIIGYDDIPTAALTFPALTTIKQPLYQIGKLAYDKASGMLDSGIPEEGVLLFEPQLMIRGSV